MSYTFLEQEYVHYRDIINKPKWRLIAGDVVPLIDDIEWDPGEWEQYVPYEIARMWEGLPSQTKTAVFIISYRIAVNKIAYEI
jgi:hypothetical protein